MALDMRVSHRRRNASDLPDWRDALIPGGVLAVLGYIAAYHHVVLLDTLRAWL